MTGKLSKNFHGVGIGPLSDILAVNTVHKKSIQLYEKLKMYYSKIEKKISCEKNFNPLGNDK